MVTSSVEVERVFLATGEGKGEVNGEVVAEEDIGATDCGVDPTLTKV